MGTTLQKIITILFLFISLASPHASASPENDRVYQLDSLGWLKSSDNVDDIFSEFLDEEYGRYFQKQSRFLVKKISSIGEVLAKSSVPYSTLIQKPEVLKRIAQKFRVESLIRTHVYKEAETYRFLLEWVYAPRGDVLSQFEFRFVDPGKDVGLKGSELPQAIQNALDQLISKLPFLGQVTGIEGDTITVNLGRNQNIQRHEILTIYTLQSLKRHPILNTIEEWRWQAIGRAQVEQVEDSLCFAKVIDVEPDQKVIRFQKIREILPAPPEEVKKVDTTPTEKDIPRLGWISGNLGLGSFSREVGAGTANTGRGGSGLGVVFEAEGLLWLNSRWLAEASLTSGITKYSPIDLSTNASTGNDYSGTANQVRLGVGYSLFPAKTIMDAIGWVHFGYRYTGYTLASLPADLTGASSIGSAFVGFGGEIPFKNLITIQMGIDLGLFRSATSVFPTYGDPTGSSDLMFELAGLYHLSGRLSARLLLKINSQSMDFAGGESISEKLLSVGPSLLYYF